ncbi:TniQ family protein [Acidovorax sp.]|uniref:TniQ family protein n=1 Tax=Acidovorax sp. TaxID=1872122 RepID=UPI00344EFFAF
MARHSFEKLKDNVYSDLKAMGGTWMPANTKMFGAPSPMDGEAFSSWCWRTAIKFRVPVSAVKEMLGIHQNEFVVDASPLDIDLENITQLTGLSRPQLNSLIWATPHRYVRGFYNLTIHPPATSSAGQPVVRYCETCLENDETPYIRRAWRLLHVHVCPMHGSVLRSSCPHCTRDVSQIARLRTNLKGSLRECQFCREDLCAVDPVTIPATLLDGFIADQLSCTRLLVSSRLCPWGIGFN